MNIDTLLTAISEKWAKEDDTGKETIAMALAKIIGTRRFKPPTLDEVTAYKVEMKLSFDPAKFMNHYDGNGWMVGKVRMKNWKAIARGWGSWNKDTKFVAKPAETFTSDPEEMY